MYYNYNNIIVLTIQKHNLHWLHYYVSRKVGRYYLYARP